MVGAWYPVGEVAPRATENGPVADTGSGLAALSGQQIGRYLVQQPLGSGGVATVYRAYDQVIGRTVALKVLLPNPDVNTQSRFRREALMAGGLRHPHVVRILQVGSARSGGIAYIAMELVEGESLSALLARYGQLRIEESCNLLAPIARALSVAHANGIIHRDVKPGNILLRTASPGIPHSVQLETLDHPVVPLLSDFGIARFIDAPELTVTGRTVGTPAFMAPEQCAGNRDVDGRADIYALGTVLFRAVVGHLPFSGSMTQIMHAQVYEPVVVDARTMESLSPRIIEILQRSLAKRPEDRYADAGELAEDLALAAGQVDERLPTVAPMGEGGATATLALPIDVASKDSAFDGTMRNGREISTVLVPGLETDIVAVPKADDAQAGGRLRRFHNPPVAAHRLASVATIMLLVIFVGGLWIWADNQRNISDNSSPSGLVDAAAAIASIAPSPSVEPDNEPSPGEESTTARSGAAEAGSVDSTQGSGVATTAPTHTIGTTAVVPRFSPDKEKVLESVPIVEPSVTETPTVLPAGGHEAGNATDQPRETDSSPTPEPAPVSNAIDADSGISLATCVYVVDEYFLNRDLELDPGELADFRCPTASAFGTSGEYLPFEHGLIVRLDERPQLYVYYAQSGEWEQVLARPMESSATETPASGAAVAGPVPTGIFGEIWQDTQRRLALGEPLAAQPEQIYALVQTFPGGILIGLPDDEVVWVFLRSRLRF